ncbi:mastermind-like domain-containing protein 1 [Protopterus annectens]|uniref:mastermind-like domain-containing protein 1 n=1 Tax=Protopterus annectens TaxID=7888 RepID=UPI001CFBE854|nr:mastermind-like domain-containing protein 1 [Protopterus annectens]
MLLVSQRVEGPGMEPPITLQGSVKRKLEEDGSPAGNGGFDGMYPSDNKRLCLDDVTLSMGQPQGTSPSVSCSEMQHSPFSTNLHSSTSSHPGLIDSSHLNGGVGLGSPFPVATNTEINPVARTNTVGPYDPKGNTSIQTVDQELQDLLEELTKIDHPTNDLDIEKILGNKSDEPLGASHSQPSMNSTPKRSPQTASHLENPVTGKEFSPSYSQASVESPQMRPPSAGAAFSLTPSSKPVPSPLSAAAQNSNAPQSSMLSSSLSSQSSQSWHAQQLKQLAASKQQVGSQQQQIQTSNWPALSPAGPSPPYRTEKLPSSSPHQQPFSPQNTMVQGMTSNSISGTNIQSPQSNLLSSISSGSNASAGPSPPYVAEKLSSPALTPQPFSPQSSMLPSITSSSLSANSIKSPQSNLVTNVASANTGPSPPYMPEKLSSPALHQPPFSPQSTMVPNIVSTSNAANLQSSLYKTQSGTLNMMLQQSSSSGVQPTLVNDSPLSQDQFSFDNTKRLSHFAPDSPSQKIPMSSGSGQSSLVHFHQISPVQQPHPPSSTAYLPQVIRTGIPRHTEPSALHQQNRQDPSLVARGPESEVRHTLLKYHMRRQQEKNRQSVMGVPSVHRGHYTTQQMTHFQGMTQNITECGQHGPNVTLPHHIMPSNSGILQSALVTGLTSSAGNQNSSTVGMMTHNHGKQQIMFPTEFGVSFRSNQNPLGITAACQTVHSQAAIRPVMSMSGFSSGSLGGVPATAQQHLRHPNMPRAPGVYSNSPGQMWNPGTVQRAAAPNPMEASMQQFPHSAHFLKQNLRPNIPGHQIPHQTVVPPNQMATLQARHMQKLAALQSGQNMGMLSNQTLQSNLSRGQLLTANGMKQMPTDMAGLNPMGHPQGLAPPCYSTTGQPSPAFSGMNTVTELPSYDFVPHQTNSVLTGTNNEAEFYDSLTKTPSGADDDWLNSLIFDDILGTST